VTGPAPASGKATSGPPPEGSLDDFPLPTFFTHVLSHRVSGSLVLKGPYGDDVVVFADGSPSRIRTAKLIAPLGEMLVRLGVIADVDLQSALFRAQKAHQRLGKHLVNESLVDKRTLLRALREQILVRVRSLASLPPETQYEFHTNTDLLEEGAPTNQITCDPLAALLAFVRAWPERRRIDEALAPFDNAPVRLHGDSDLDRFELDDAERALIAKIRTSAVLTHVEVYKSSVAPERSIRALLYVLHLTHHLDDGTSIPPLDRERSSDPVNSLRDSTLSVRIDPLRTTAKIKALGAADDFREATALWKAGNLEAAQVLASRAVERIPDPGYKALLGIIVAQQGGKQNFKRGVALLNEAISAGPGDDRALVYRATVMRDAGKIDLAIRDWRAALAINPKNPDAKVALKRAELAADSSAAPAGSGSAGWWLLAVILVCTAAMLFVLVKTR
jgi:tetratricopeptide (TPR) repeat protein